MDLPKLTPGKRHALPRPPGSADALLLAQTAQRAAEAKRLTAIVTADAVDARRLQDELAFFAPALRVVMFPDWETLPYDTFSPHQDLISERLATLWAIRQGQADVAKPDDSDTDVGKVAHVFPWSRKSRGAASSLACPGPSTARCHGARSRDRTDMALRPRDFKSLAFTSFAIRAARQSLRDHAPRNVGATPHYSSCDCA